MSEQRETTVNGRPWHGCYTCHDYLDHRQGVIEQPLTDKAVREGRDPVAVVDEFMAGAHRRHVDGQPLRPGGPTRITDPEIGRVMALLSPGLVGALSSSSSVPGTPGEREEGA